MVECWQMNEEQPLNKKERRALRKQEKRESRERSERLGKWRKWGLWLVVIVVGVWVLGRGLGSGSDVEALGENVDDLGRAHMTDISEIAYNSNPPTSGSHFPVWAKPGFYDRVISDGHLLHSLEHGYVVVSYDCTNLKLSNAKFKIINLLVSAHEGDDIPEDLPHPVQDSGEATEGVEDASVSAKPLMRMRVGLEGAMSSFTPENSPDEELVLGEEFSSDSCEELRKLLSEFFEKNKNKRLIVVPRSGMSTSIAMTAWNRVFKLDGWDELLTEEFLKQWHNRGPEQTIE